MATEKVNLLAMYLWEAMHSKTVTHKNDMLLYYSSYSSTFQTCYYLTMVELGKWSLKFFVIWRLAYYNIHTLFMFSLVLFVKLWSVFFQFLITDQIRKVLAFIYYRIHTVHKHDAAVLMLHGWYWHWLFCLCVNAVFLFPFKVENSILSKVISVKSNYHH